MIAALAAAAHHGRWFHATPREGLWIAVVLVALLVLGLLRGLSS